MNTCEEKGNPEIAGNIHNATYQTNIAGDQAGGSFLVRIHESMKVSQFGVPGDSGSLIYFKNGDNVKQGIGLFHKINPTYITHNQRKENMAVCLSLKNNLRAIRKNLNIAVEPAENWSNSKLETQEI